MLLKCPICGKERESAENRFRPFCSERCKLFDLADWVDGKYRIPGEQVEERPDDDEKPEE